jgi:hypothetical protein
VGALTETVARLLPAVGLTGAHWKVVFVVITDATEKPLSQVLTTFAKLKVFQA